MDIEEFAHALLSEGKDASDVAAYEEPVHQAPAWHGVTDMIPAKRATVLFDETVRMLPEAIGPLQLLVHEGVGWLPVGDARSPTERPTVYLESVVNQSSPLHGDGAGSPDLKIHPPGSECLKISCIRKEGENRFPVFR